MSFSSETPSELAADSHACHATDLSNRRQHFHRGTLQNVPHQTHSTIVLREGMVDG